MKPTVIILGAGDHARVLAATLRESGRRVTGFIDPDVRLHGTQIDGVRVLGGEELLDQRRYRAVELANGLGSIGPMRARRAGYLRFAARGFRFATVIHPRAFVAHSACLGEGAQIFAGAMIQIHAAIGSNCIVNTGAIVEHDCRVGDHSHLAPGCVLSGAVQIGASVHIGTGASVIQYIRIGDGAIVGAGSAVIRDVPRGATVVGVPARRKRA